MTNTKGDNIVDLDEFRKNAPPKKETRSENARFTANEERQLQAAFQYGKDVGALSAIKMEKGIALSLCQFTTIDKNAPTLSVSKRPVLGEMKFSSDSSRQGLLESSPSFKDVLSSVYDFIAEHAPTRTLAAKPKI